MDLASGATRGQLGTLSAVSTDGAHVVIGGPPRLHETATGLERMLPTAGIRTASFSEDGRRLAVASRTVLSVVDVVTGELIAVIGEHHDEEGNTYEGVGLNPDGNRLVSTSLGGGRGGVWDCCRKAARCSSAPHRRWQ